MLTVAQEYRKTGLAAAMMQAIEKFAIAVQFTSIGLDYMSAAPWLKKYYEGCGFTETGEVAPWGSINLIHMVKKLPRQKF